MKEYTIDDFRMLSVEDESIGYWKARLRMRLGKAELKEEED